jgi:DNA-binding MarR family transcriptional regulator
MHRDHEIEGAATDLYALGKLLRDAWRLQVPELPPASLAVLGTLVAHGPLRVGEVARLQHIDESVASRQVSALTVRGLVARERDASDARVRRINATERGQQLMQGAHERIVATMGDALAGWEPAELTGLATGLARLRSDLNDVLDEPRLPELAQR